LRAVLLLLLIGAAPASAPGIDYSALRAADARMGAIAYRLALANAPLCRDRVPATGLVLHALQQYGPGERPAARAAFGFPAPVAVEAVVPGSPAARAGVRADDGLVAVGGDRLPAAAPEGAASAAPRDAARSLIARTAGPVRLTLRRDGGERTVTLDAPPACASDFEVLLGPGFDAGADGRLVQVGVRFLERYSDDQVAVIAAHELAHNVLAHPSRLDAARVNRGLLKEFGRNGRMFRRTEDEADRLGAILYRNAGWRGADAAAFWRDHGREFDRGLFRARTHAGAQERARSIAAEVAAIPPAAPVPYVPPLLATRDEPLQ